ncbi:MAG TPA: hypothetical protein VF116_19620 [Ktedonobacterales bacterium]
MSRRWYAGLALIVLLAVALAGCDGGASTATARTVSPTATAPSGPTSWPTVTPSGTPCRDYMSQQSSIIRAGDLLVAPAFADTETTLYQLPDGTPLQPLEVPQQSSNGQFAGWPVSTLGASDIYAAVCNGSTATAHTVQGARVKLAGFTAYSGQLSAWDYCAGYYARPAGVTPNNCDRGTAPTDEMLQAEFASDAPVGTIVAATQSAPPAEGFGPLPAVLPPGSVMYLHLGLTAPVAQGTYAFAVSITVDGAQLPFTGAASLLLAPIGHSWNGQGCTSSAMQAQIPPATNPPTPYICPTS